MNNAKRAGKTSRSVFLQDQGAESTDRPDIIDAEVESNLELLLAGLKAARKGDFSVKLPTISDGLLGALYEEYNEVMALNQGMAEEVIRVSRIVGEEGRLTERAAMGPAAVGLWATKLNAINSLINNMAQPTTEIARVITAVADGNLTEKMALELNNRPVQGEFLRIGTTVNTMVDQLSAFASEVTRVAREVGTDGKLGGQAEVKGVAGTWRDLTDSINLLACTLTNQVRNIADVTTAVANGDLSRKITVEAQGEVRQLKNTINSMVDNLNSIIGNINRVTATVAEGTLTELVDVSACGEYASMVNGINGTVKSLHRIVAEMTEAGVGIVQVSGSLLSSGQEMNSMVTQLSSSVEQIAKGAKTQAQQIADASKESEGVGSAASNTLSSAEGMNQMSEIASKATAEGSEAMKEAIKSTDLMLRGSKNSVTGIESLSKSNEQIQEIVDFIRDIATQTNILAINAAIEAVRAGKQGKGFAVVAEEVKALSADSKTQAKQISTLVQAVQRETEETAETIKQMAQKVETGKESIEQTSNAFQDIRSSIESTSRASSEISIAAADQKKSIDSISISLDRISGTAADTSAGSAQLADSTKRLLGRMQELTATATTLADMSRKFQQTVERFNIGDTTPTKKAEQKQAETQPGATHERQIAVGQAKAKAA